MPQSQTRSRRLATAARWPFGLALTSWRYLWRTTPLAREEVRGSLDADSPPPLTPVVKVDNKIQLPEEGAGPFFRRRYRVKFRGSRASASELMDEVAGDPDVVAPSEFATFQKTSGEDGSMGVGDEYVVRMPGPWDGPVRVVAREPGMFRLATLDGHLEAGQIEFRATDSGDLIIFEIESWARSGDAYSDLLYDRLRMSKEVQMHMWTSTLERVVELAGGTRAGRLEIHTRRVPMQGWGEIADGIIDKLASLSGQSPNFDPGELPEVADDPWHVDDYCTELPAEPPGEPVEAGSFETAKRLMSDYEFADPEMVQAYYDGDTPLLGRDMLLEIRYHGLRVPVGVRVTQIFDEVRDVEGEAVRVWGWAYQTLEDHIESGQMDYQVWKWLSSGRVEFRIHAVSQRAPIHNPFIAVGFRAIGRREQVRFARRCGERMKRLIALDLPSSGSEDPVPDRVDGVAVSPSA